MELSQEFIEANGLSEEQVTAFSGFVQTEIVPTIKKEYDGKANENAEGILSGAAKYAKEKLGIEDDREQGEKWGDYFQRISDTAISSKNQKLLDREQELEGKLKNFKGSDELKQKLEDQLKANDDLLKKVADLEPLKGMDALLEQKNQELTGLKRTVAFNSVKPNFPDTVNKYEADAKWGEWVKNVEEKYDIELIDGVPYGVDKDNHHKKIKLSEVIKADENINTLLKGRQQGGTGANPADMQAVDGLPFTIPKNGSSEDLTKIVKEHLLKELGSITHKDYSTKFKELYTKAKSA